MPNIFAKQGARPPFWILEILRSHRGSKKTEDVIINRYRRCRYFHTKMKYLEHFDWLVRAIAQHYTADPDKLQHLIVVGYRAIEEAADRYQLEKDYLFRSYASWWIYTYIKLYLKTNRGDSK